MDTEKTDKQLYQQEYYKKNKKNIQEKARIYYEKNKEKYSRRQKLYNKKYYLDKKYKTSNNSDENKIINNTVYF